MDTIKTISSVRPFFMPAVSNISTEEKFKKFSFNSKILVIKPSLACWFVIILIIGLDWIWILNWFRSKFFGEFEFYFH